MFDQQPGVLSIVSLLPSPPHKFLPSSFPKFTGQSLSSSSAVKAQSLDRHPVEVKPVVVEVNEDVTYLPLKVDELLYKGGYKYMPFMGLHLIFNCFSYVVVFMCEI